MRSRFTKVVCFCSHPDNTTIVNFHFEHTNPFFLWFKRDIVNYLFIAFNFLLALCNIPQRFLNYISFPTNFFVAFHKRLQEFFSFFPPFFLSFFLSTFLLGLMYSFYWQFNHFIVLPLR